MNNNMRSHICKHCDNCKRLYRFEYGNFRTAIYFCTARNCVTLRGDSCENWQKRVKVDDLSPQRIDGVIADVERLGELLSDIKE